MSQSTYRASIRAPSRGLWSGALTFDQFFDSMLTSIRLGLTQGWNRGALSMGIRPDEKTAADRIELQRLIIRESGFINTLGEFIESNRRELQPRGQIRNALNRVFNRLERWVVRWLDAHNRGVLSARGDPKLLWIYDPRKENCRTCARLNGKVKRRSTWIVAGVRPQNSPNPLLDCEGWECGCQLVPTSEPLSRGPLPGLP